MFYEVLDKLTVNTEQKWPLASKYISARKIPEGTELSIPVLNDNYIILGTTGYGKTTITKEILNACISEKEDDYIVFFDIKDDYRNYIRPEDKVIACFESEWNTSYDIFKWNMIKECRQSENPDAMLDAIADILFADLLDGKNRFFAEGAKNIFKGYIKTILHCYKNCPGNKEVIDGMKCMSYKEIITHLLKYKPNCNIIRDYFGYDITNSETYNMPKRTGDIMAFLSTVLEKFSGTFYSETGMDTIHDYLEGNKYGKRLFLIYDYSERASSNMFFRFFLQKIIEERLKQNADISNHMILMLDEIATLEGDFGIMEAVTIGRGRNLQVILCSQSVEKLYCIAPERNMEHITRASFSGYPTIIAFHPSDIATIELLQQLFGMEQKQIEIVPMSRYGQLHSQYVMEPKISSGELANLGLGECYIKIKDAAPIRLKINQKEKVNNICNHI